MIVGILAVATVLLLVFLFGWVLMDGRFRLPWLTIVGLLICSSADACPRCGIFGRGCRFVSHAVVQQQAVAYSPPAVTQNLIFNNSFPTPFLSQGNSVYGYSLAAAPYTFDSTAYMDRASRFQELALETAQQGINGFNANAAAATALADAVDRRTKNAMVALAAINANQQSPVPTVASAALSAQAAPTVTRFTVTLREGQAPVVTTDPPQRDPNVPPAPPGPFQAFAAGQALLQQCGRCHDGTGLHHEPKTVVLNGTQAIDQALYEKCLDQINSGKMPKDAPLTSQPIANAVRDDLRALIRQAAQ